MTLLTVSDLSRYYGADLIFSALGFSVARGEKVALVGPNGAGKSTLLKIIAGLLPPDEGTAHVVRGNRVAYLPQEAHFTSERTLWQEMKAAFAHLQDLEAELRRLEQRLSDTEAPDWEACMQHYGELTTRFEHAGGYRVDQQIEYTLHHLGFSEELYEHPVSWFSGGQKTRAALAAALLSDPDLLLLDEPTNHLDLHALEWLESFLTTWSGTLMVVSHDRYFLDRVTNRTLEIADGHLEDYPAGYSGYLALKAERMEQRLKAYEAQQEMIARTEAFIRRYKAGQRAKEAKGREKRLDRYKEQQMLARPKEEKTLRLSLENQLRSGELVLACHDVVVGYKPSAPMDREQAPRKLVHAHRLELHRGERVALLGPNGSGKTTFLRTLMGELSPLRGAFQTGHNVAMGYYAQGHESLDMEATVLDEVLQVSPKMGEEKARTLLGRFLFYGDDVFKRVHQLSGGERNRVVLAQLMLKPGNLLVMDEPTNHLDISAREALEEVMGAYTGSILFVSHDRFFVDALADKLWIVEDGRLVEYLGSYRAYQEMRSRAREQEKNRPPKERAKSSAAAGRGEATEERQRKKRMAELETTLEHLEQEFEQVRSALDTASTAQDVAQITELGNQYVALEEQIGRCYDEWVELSEL